MCHRDFIIGNITNTTILTSNLTNQSTFSGTTTWANFTYVIEATYVRLMPNTSYGINHNLTVGVNDIPANDGLVAVIVVHITGTPQNSYVIFFISTVLLCNFFIVRS